MKLTEKQREILTDVGEKLLNALTVVSKAAASQLKESVEVTEVLLTSEGRHQLASIQGEVRQSLQRLKSEPIIARLVIEWHETEPIQEIIYVCRGSAAGVGSAIKSGRLASYRSPLGRLAELAVGDQEVILLPRSGEREARLLERGTFLPVGDSQGWDALNNQLAFQGWRVGLQSVRRFLQEIGRAGVALDDAELLEQILAEATAADIVREKIRRQTIDRIALRDQAILDANQGEVFRLPINKRLVMLGPPGTGKTTTLIKRIAQKGTVSELGDEERELINNFGLDMANWVMYSPTELLKLYLRDAFNKESVPADSRNLRTWEAERIDLGRNTLGIIRGTSGGRYILTTDKELLLDSTSPSLSSLHDEFLSYMGNWVVNRCEKALMQIEELRNPEADGALNLIRRKLGTGPITLPRIFDLADNRDLSEEVRRLSHRTIERTRSIARRLLDREILNHLVTMLPDLGPKTAGAIDVEEDDVDEEEEVLGTSGSGQTETEKQRRGIEMLQRALSSLARASAQRREVPVGSKASRVLEYLGSRIPSEDESVELGGLLILRDGLRRLHRSARDYVFRIPTAYSRFRREACKAKRWYRDDAQPQLDNNRIHSSEVDMLILCMLRNARVVDAVVRESEWLSPIRDRYAMQVYVDEATDFSAVELACMLELAHPKLRSWFACGDFRQRITWSGITGPDELHWIKTQTGVDNLEMREVKQCYRQSPRLIALTNELAKLQGFEERWIEAPDSEFPDYAPLCIEGISGDALAVWLSGRIVEIERAVGHLPSIAIFVDGDERIDPLVEGVSRYLQDHGLRIVGCKEGRIVGAAQEVRVFDVRHIKGLEFEAVFCVGIDQLAVRLPELFDRYLYVAISRAATYLGVTNEGKLPQRLDNLRSHFSTATWQA